MKITVKALLIGGKIDWSNMDRDRLREYARRVDGQEVNVTFDNDVMKRSEAQNAFFHSVIMGSFMRMLRNLGHPKWGDREYVKECVLKKPYLTVGSGTADEYVRPTSSLKVKEMWDFITWCLQLLVTLGGDLNDREQEEYLKIIRDYKLDTALDDAISKKL